MKRLVYILLISVLAVGCRTTADTNTTPGSTLFHIDQQPVRSDEFVYMLTKNNNDSILTDEEIRDYLRLYINFKLKVTDAKRLGYDTLKVLNQEFTQYKNQLLEPYYNLDSLNDSLIYTAYERTLEEIHAAHILITLPPNPTPEDTLEAYEKIMDIREKALSGSDFNSLAKNYSQDPSANRNGGDLGYFSAFKMVYPFEIAAYSTDKGDVSKPVRTRFGYHIIKVLDRRPSRGQVRVAHILVRSGRTASDSTDQKKILNAYRVLQKGESWDKVCREYSDDINTKNNGGLLPWFSPGRTAPSFEAAAFALDNPGEISEPVRTPYGWHIIKLIGKKGHPPFSEVKEQITQRLQRSAGQNMARELLIKKLKQKHHFHENRENLYSITEVLKRDSNAIKLSQISDSIANKTIVSIGSSQYKARELIEYMNEQANTNRPNYNIQALYNNFTDQLVLNYEEDRIRKNNPDLNFLIKEYKEGLLLFQIMDDHVWKRAVEDSAGLVNYFQNNRNKYTWDQRVQAIIISQNKPVVAQNENVIQQLVKAYSEYGQLADTLASFTREKGMTFKEGKFEKGDEPILDQIQWSKGFYKISGEGIKNYVIIHKILPSQPKELNEIRGRVIADYQNELDKEWIRELNDRYVVNINDKEFNKIVKRFENH